MVQRNPGRRATKATSIARKMATTDSQLATQFFPMNEWEAVAVDSALWQQNMDGTGVMNPWGSAD